MTTTIIKSKKGFQRANACEPRAPGPGASRRRCWKAVPPWTRHGTSLQNLCWAHLVLPAVGKAQKCPSGERSRLSPSSLTLSQGLSQRGRIGINPTGAASNKNRRNNRNNTPLHNRVESLCQTPWLEQVWSKCIWPKGEEENATKDPPAAAGPTRLVTPYRVVLIWSTSWSKKPRITT